MPPLQRQVHEPLFGDLLWSKPVNRQAAKQLVIVGGSAGHFQQAQLAYESARAAGIGALKLILPDRLESVIGRAEDRLYVPSTSSGSIDKSALGPIQSWISQSDGALLAGDFSHHTSTISLIEQLLTTIDRPLGLTKEIIQSMLYEPNNLTAQSPRLLLSDTQTLVKLAAKLNLQLELKANAGLINKINLLNKINQEIGADVVLVSEDLLVVSHGQASLTPLAQANIPLVSGYLTTFWLQYPDSFKALTTGAFALSQAAAIGGGAGGS